MLEAELLLLTPEKASRLARHYLGLVQILREIAGEPPIETGAQRRKEERVRTS
jgi:hypothetical protein